MCAKWYLNLTNSIHPLAVFGVLNSKLITERAKKSWRAFLSFDWSKVKRLSVWVKMAAVLSVIICWVLTCLPFLHHLYSVTCVRSSTRFLLRCFDTIFSWVSVLCTCHFPVLIASFLGFRLIPMISVLHHTVIQSISSPQSLLCQSFFISLYQKIPLLPHLHSHLHKVCKANNVNSL